MTTCPPLLARLGAAARGAPRRRLPRAAEGRPRWRFFDFVTAAAAVEALGPPLAICLATFAAPPVVDVVVVRASSWSTRLRLATSPSAATAGVAVSVAATATPALTTAPPSSIATAVASAPPSASSTVTLAPASAVVTPMTA